MKKQPIEWDHLINRPGGTSDEPNEEYKEEYDEEFADEYQDEYAEYPEPQKETDAERTERVSKGTAIYKFLCVCMGLCLIAGSVVWATMFLKDRTQKPIKNDSYYQPVKAEQKTEETEKQTKATTTTTTADPYKIPVEPDFEDSYGTMYTIGENAVLRIGPGYDYEKVDAQIPENTPLDVSAEQEDAKSGEPWCFVTYEEKPGWVNKSYLSSTNRSVAVVKPDEYYDDIDKEDVTVIRDGGLKLYSGPDESYDVLMTLDEGDELTKEGSKNLSLKWVYVSYGEQYGWVKTYDGDWFNPTIE